jgi:hypothetical protein
MPPTVPPTRRGRGHRGPGALTLISRPPPCERSLPPSRGLPRRRARRHCSSSGVSFPLVLVDETQDLSAERSAIVAALAQSGTVLLAFDEFQCLNLPLLPIAIEAWLCDHCEPITLEGCRRTNDAELIDAARAVRNGQAVNRAGRRFKVMAAPGQALAATCLANAIAWRNGGNVAVLTPSRQGGFADDAVARVCAGAVGQRRSGPFAIEWESGEEQNAAGLWSRLGLADRCMVEDALAAMAPHRNDPAIRMVRDWVGRQRSIRGLEELTAEEMRRQLDRALSLRVATASEAASICSHDDPAGKESRIRSRHRPVAYTVPNNDKQRRRLMYNAITRAKRSCTLLVQNQALMSAPPFAPREEEA